MGVAVIAEGVESVAELAALPVAGIRRFPGYLFAKPASASLPAVHLPASSALPAETPARDSAEGWARD